MHKFQLSTPVVFIIFNRPDTTAKVFAEIRKAKPRKLLIIGDGPRENRNGEKEKVESTRAFVDQVDWNCEVLTNFSDVNLGCKRRVASGLDWVFETAEEAIILEDDCIPDQSFFRFCEELLERYRNDQRVAMISGNNFQRNQRRGDASYYFSQYSHIWGWASWRRAWKHYDVEARVWPAMRDGNWCKEITSGKRELDHWINAFQSVYDGKVDTWDYQWALTVWTQGMLSIVPNFNLVSNIGFGIDATHTRNVSEFSNMEVVEMKFPLIHPNIFRANFEADRFTGQNNFSSPTFGQRISRRIKRLWKN